MNAITILSRPAWDSRPRSTLVLVRRSEPATQVVVDRHVAVWLLFGATALVILLGIFREGYLARFGLGTPLKDLRHIALDSEHTLASWFSALTLFVAAWLLGTVATLVRQEGHDWRRWALLSSLFAVMSLDEAVSFHELLIKPLRALFGFDGALFFAWVVPGAVAVTALGLYYLPFLYRLPRRHAVRFVLCGLIHVGGALGMEMVGGYYASHYGMESARYIVAAVIEESMEMIGVSGFCWALVAYLRERWPTWSVRVA